MAHSRRRPTGRSVNHGSACLPCSCSWWRATRRAAHPRPSRLRTAAPQVPASRMDGMTQSPARSWLLSTVATVKLLYACRCRGAVRGRPGLTSLDNDGTVVAAASPAAVVAAVFGAARDSAPPPATRRRQAPRSAGSWCSRGPDERPTPVGTDLHASRSSDE